MSWKLSEMTMDDLNERLILSAINTKKAGDYLEDCPHISKGSLSLVAFLCSGDKDQKGMYSFFRPVTKRSLEIFERTLGLDKESLFAIATENSRKTFPVMIEPIDMEGLDLPPCLALSNTKYFNGASTMFYEPDVLRRIADKYKTDVLYLGVSYTSFVICVPQNNAITKDELDSVIAEMTDTLEQKKRDLGPMLGTVLPLSATLIYDKTQNRIIEPTGESYSPDILDNGSTKINKTNSR
ncbi:DUF5688 family protein [[Clostridium] aminophilum]|uniref:DUF5688 family protein n=1 Tax=[Clostridium] aminophilum TaxID=1526 RepID=UPI003F9BBCA3